MLRKVRSRYLPVGPQPVLSRQGWICEKHSASSSGGWRKEKPKIYAGEGWCLWAFSLKPDGGCFVAHPSPLRILFIRVAKIDEYCRLIMWPIKSEASKATSPSVISIHEAVECVLAVVAESRTMRSNERSLHQARTGLSTSPCVRALLERCHETELCERYTAGHIITTQCARIAE